MVGREQQTAHTKSTERATAKGMCISTDYSKEVERLRVVLASVVEQSRALTESLSDAKIA